MKYWIYVFLFCLAISTKVQANRTVQSAPDVWSGVFWPPVAWDGTHANQTCVVRSTTISVANLGKDPAKVKFSVKVLSSTFTAFNFNFGILRIFAEGTDILKSQILSTPITYTTLEKSIGSGSGTFQKFSLHFTVPNYVNRNSVGYMSLQSEVIYGIEAIGDRGALIASIDAVGASSGCLDTDPNLLTQWQSTLAGRTSVPLNGGRPF